MVMDPVSRLRSLATGPRATGVAVAFVAITLGWFRFGPAARLTATGVPLLDAQTAYGPDQAYVQLATYGELGRRQYAQFLVGDFVWVLLFGVTVSVLLLLALRYVRREGPRWSWILVLPASVVALDWFENAALLMMTLQFPERLDSLAGVVPLATRAKLTLVNVTFLAALVAVGTVIVLAVGRASRHWKEAT